MKTIFGVASIPGREKNLKASLESILPQCDKVHVYLNNYPHAPDFLNHDKIIVYRSQDHGDRSDAGKFFNVPENCYYFSIDDDIIYPPTYVADMKAELNKWHNQVIVTHHGRVLRQSPVKSYYKGKTAMHHCRGHQAQDRWVHVGGTGVMAFDTNYFRPSKKDFKAPHMADIWVGIKAQSQKMPILALAHPSGYIQPQGNIGPTIFDRHVKNDGPQTRVRNSIQWTLYKGVLQ